MDTATAPEKITYSDLATISLYRALRGLYDVCLESQKAEDLPAAMYPASRALTDFRSLANEIAERMDQHESFC